ncbi:unnamed protein product, partial [marine sediment metagenome]
KHTKTERPSELLGRIEQLKLTNHKLLISHDALVEALKKLYSIRSRISGCQDPECSICKENKEVFEQVEQALADAKGDK